MKRLAALLFLIAVGTSYGQTTSAIANFPFNFQTKPTTDQIILWDNTDTNVLGGTGGITYVNIGTGLTYTHSTHTLTAAAGGGGMTNPMTTLGDIITGGSASAPARLGIGSTNQVLTVVSGVPAWGTPAAAPSVTGTGYWHSTSGTLDSAAATSIPDASVSFTDVTTGNATNSQHGFLPKTPADATKFLNGGTGPTYTSVAFSVLTGTPTSAQRAPRVQDNNAPTSPVTPDSDSYDGMAYRGLTAALTLNAPTGTPTPQQKLLIRFKDNGTSRTLTFTTGTNGFRASTDLPFPTATTANKTLICGFIWNNNDSTWDMVAKLDNF